MHEGPRTVRPTPGQRCVEWPQSDAGAKLWVRRTNTNYHVTNTGDADFRPIWAHLLAPTCNSNMQSQHVSGTAGNSSDYSLLCYWIFYIAIQFVYGLKDLWENQHNLDQLRTLELS